MKTLVLLGTLTAFSLGLFAQDWPQWRGPDRNGKAQFKAPATWPKELKQQWKKTVGPGEAGPVLVHGKLYVFSREGDTEVLRCLNAADGNQLWEQKYETGAATGPAGAHPGPRATPAVANGKVVTFGVRGVLSCFDAEKGDLAWRKDEIKGWPQFFTSTSPIITDGLAIAQVGGAQNGTIVAYDLASGNEKWKWAGDGTAYASPVVMKSGGINAIIAVTDKEIVAVNSADGKLLLQLPWAGRGMGGYNASTPLIDGSTLYIAGGGRGAKAFKVEKKGDELSATELWSNPDRSVVFNSPILKDGRIYGISDKHEFFAIDARDGKSLWAAPVNAPAGNPAAAETGAAAQNQNQNPGQAQGQGQGPGRGGRGGGMRGGGGRTSGYGSIVDAGSVLLAMTPSSELIVFKPSEKEFSEVARIKLSETPIFAHLVVSGNRIFTKDQDSLAAWSVE
jgi:outer membrane protein assembly factor BamB